MVHIYDQPIPGVFILDDLLPLIYQLSSGSPMAELELYTQRKLTPLADRIKVGTKALASAGPNAGVIALL